MLTRNGTLLAASDARTHAQLLGVASDSDDGDDAYASGGGGGGGGGSDDAADGTLPCARARLHRVRRLCDEALAHAADADGAPPSDAGGGVDDGGDDGGDDDDDDLLSAGAPRVSRISGFALWHTQSESYSRLQTTLSPGEEYAGRLAVMCVFVGSRG